MTQKEFDNLRRGDIVMLKGTGISYVIEHSLRNSYIANRTIEVTNPNEWNLFIPPKKKDHE